MRLPDDPRAAGSVQAEQGEEQEMEQGMNDTPRRICAWCGGPLKPTTVSGSHGICPQCVREYFPDYADEVLDDGFESAAETVSGYGRKEN
jgi:hypothetical protein